MSQLDGTLYFVRQAIFNKGAVKKIPPTAAKKILFLRLLVQFFFHRPLVESQHKVCVSAPVPSTVRSTRSRTRRSTAFQVTSGKG